MIDQSERRTTYDLRNFTIRDMTECGRALRRMNDDAASMEEIAGRIVRHLYDNLVDGATGGKACSLVRFFKTHAYERLNDELKGFALKMLGGSAPLPETKCFTLLGTVGENQEWNLRSASNGHQAIPLPSEEVVHQIPMMRNVIKQLGLSVSSVLKPDPALLLDMEQKTYSVFLVPEALGSPYIPAQENFVVPYGIKSVMGFGGILPSGDLFVIIMFLKTPVEKETADLFKNLSLNIKLAILPFETRVFA